MNITMPNKVATIGSSKAMAAVSNDFKLDKDEK